MSLLAMNAAPLLSVRRSCSLEMGLWSRWFLRKTLIMPTFTMQNGEPGRLERRRQRRRPFYGMIKMKISEGCLVVCPADARRPHGAEMALTAQTPLYCYARRNSFFDTLSACKRNRCVSPLRNWSVTITTEAKNTKSPTLHNACQS